MQEPDMLFCSPEISSLGDFPKRQKGEIQLNYTKILMICFTVNPWSATIIIADNTYHTRKNMDLTTSRNCDLLRSTLQSNAIIYFRPASLIADATILFCIASLETNSKIS